MWFSKNVDSPGSSATILPGTELDAALGGSQPASTASTKIPDWVPFTRPLDIEDSVQLSDRSPAASFRTNARDRIRELESKIDAVEDKLDADAGALPSVAGPSSVTLGLAEHIVSREAPDLRRRVKSLHETKARQFQEIEAKKEIIQALTKKLELRQEEQHEREEHFQKQIEHLKEQFEHERQEHVRSIRAERRAKDETATRTMEAIASATRSMQETRSENDKLTQEADRLLQRVRELEADLKQKVDALEKCEGALKRETAATVKLREEKEKERREWHQVKQQKQKQIMELEKQKEAESQRLEAEVQRLRQREALTEREAQKLSSLIDTKISFGVEQRLEVERAQHDRDERARLEKEVERLQGALQSSQRESDKYQAQVQAQVVQRVEQAADLKMQVQEDTSSIKMQVQEQTSSIKRQVQEDTSSIIQQVQEEIKSMKSSKVRPEHSVACHCVIS